MNSRNLQHATIETGTLQQLKQPNEMPKYPTHYMTTDVKVNKVNKNIPKTSHKDELIKDFYWIKYYTQPHPKTTLLPHKSLKAAKITNDASTGM